MKCALCRIATRSALIPFLLFSSPAIFADTLALWTFENSITTSAGPFLAEGGNNGGISEALGGTGGTYSSVAGNGSARSFSSNGWDTGDYWQFKTPTIGYTELSISFDQTGSATGPSQFKVATSSDGTNFSDLPLSTYSVTVTNWDTATFHSGFTHTFSLPATLQGLSFAYVRLIDSGTTSIGGGTVAGGGTDRIDNVRISAAPEPATLVSAGCMLLFVATGLVRRRFTCGRG